MKRTLLLMMICALLLTQCKKPVVKYPTAGHASENMVSMTVTVGHGSKTDIGPTGLIKWSAGDKLYVGDGNKYIGCLEIQSGAGEITATFSGNVTATDGTYTFGFYYLGSNPPEMEIGGTSVDISFATQTGLMTDLDACHIGYGTATGKVDGGNVVLDNFGQVTMTSKVAIAYFDFKDDETANPYKDAIMLSGDHIYSSMAVKFDGDEADKFKGETPGAIRLTDLSHSKKYVMLVPPENVCEETLNFGGCATGSTKLYKGIESNKFYCLGEGNPIEVSVKPVGFTVSRLGDKVAFSTGNLQYWGKETDKKWRFAEHQYDYMGYGPGNNNKYGNVDLSAFGYVKGEYNKVDSSGDSVHVARDLFGWGATGHKDNRSGSHVCNYEPYSMSKAKTGCSNNTYGYGPDYYGESEYGLEVSYMSDWGCNTIYTYSGEETEYGWRTLTKLEWYYLLRNREESYAPEIGENVDCRYAMVKVGGVCGIMIFPDVFEWPSVVTQVPYVFNGSEINWNSVDYGVGSGSEFEMLESAGVVFLPAAGYRIEKTLYNVGAYGRYWSSACRDEARAWYESLHDESVSENYGERYMGVSVRLVRDR